MPISALVAFVGGVAATMTWYHMNKTFRTQSAVLVRTTPNQPSTQVEPQLVIIMSVDLCAGTDISNKITSTSTITSKRLLDGTIVRFDSFESTSYVEWESALRAHFKYIRSDVMLQTAVVAVDIKATGSAERAHVSMFIRQIDGRVIIMD